MFFSTNSKSIIICINHQTFSKANFDNAMDFITQNRRSFDNSVILILDLLKTNNAYLSILIKNSNIVLIEPDHVYKSRYPMSFQEIVNEYGLHSFFQNTTKPYVKTCECGKEKHNFFKHSDWCPKA